VVATFTKRAREATIGARAIQEATEAAIATTPDDAKLAFANAEGMQE
jgi:hypothetical protein